MGGIASVAESSHGMNQTLGGARFRGNEIQIIIENDEEHKDGGGAGKKSSRGSRKNRFSAKNSN